jgi:superfamily II DNA or RNA helicase
MTSIYDNIKSQIGEAIADTVRDFDRIDVAVGYFNLRGWSLFSDAIDQHQSAEATVARVLVGMTTPGPDELVQAYLAGREEALNVDGNRAAERRVECLRRFQHQLQIGAPTERDLVTLRKLRAQLISRKVVVKLFTRRPMHAKLYICHREDRHNPRIAFVGSSNLTMAGLKHNYELNVDVVDRDGTEKLNEWFIDRWDDQFSLDITDELVAIIDESWVGREVTPYEIYLKTCYHLCTDIREGLGEFELPLELRSQLLEFQVSAAKTIARRLTVGRGMMLGDATGLGKTMTATAIAAILRDEGVSPVLVICPKNLVKMWQNYMETYNLTHKVIAYSRAISELENLRRYPFVIVDESHTLRHSTRQDYAAIVEYIKQNDSKVLLLTATPFNISFIDVANQLGLYLDDTEDLGIVPLQALQNDPNLANKVDGLISSLAAFRKSEYAEDWRRLMSEHLVRRTRAFIRRNYAQIENGRDYLLFANGDKFFFPDRVPKPLNHVYPSSDPASRMEADETLDTLGALLLPRYGLGRYLDDQQKLSAAEKIIAEDLKRSRGMMRGITRSSLFKRLASCGAVFITSLERHLERNEITLYALENDKPIPIGNYTDSLIHDLGVVSAPANGIDVFNLDDEAGDDNDANLAENTADAYKRLVIANVSFIRWADSKMFVVKDLVNDLKRDNLEIREMLAGFGGQTSQNDSKIQSLFTLLSKTHANEKIVVFTEFRDTAEYIGKTLLELGFPSTDLEVVSGSTTNPQEAVYRFAPQANKALIRESHRENQIRVLISTDVLSEGQNLQDAHVLVCFDLPWATIKLVQRAGRIDRLGQEAPKVLLYHYFHQSIENELRLRERIAARLKQAGEVFGSDEKFFGLKGEGDRIQNAFLDKIEADEDGPTDAPSRAFAVWKAVQEDDPSLAKKIEMLSYQVWSTRASRPAEAESVLSYVRSERGIDGFASIGQDGSSLLLTSEEALGIFEATKKTKTLPRLARHLDDVKRMLEGLLDRSHLGANAISGIRRRVYNRLKDAQVAKDDPEVGAALTALTTHPLMPQSERKLREKFARGVSVSELAEFVKIIHGDGRLVIEDLVADDPARLICSLGVRVE